MPRTDVNKIKEKYPEGTHVCLNHMDDKFAPPEGTYGVVTNVDDMGNIRVNWHNGSTLALIEDVDDFDIIDPYMERCRDCIALVSGDNGSWVCDEKEMPCHKVEVCPEGLDL